MQMSSIFKPQVKNQQTLFHVANYVNEALNGLFALFPEARIHGWLPVGEPKVIQTNVSNGNKWIAFQTLKPLPKNVVLPLPADDRDIQYDNHIQYDNQDNKSLPVPSAPPATSPVEKPTLTATAQCATGNVQPPPNVQPPTNSIS